jgi:hypothetical protein
MGGWRGGTLVGVLAPRWRRLGVAVLAFALLTLVLPAFADTPQTGTDPSVTLTVSPSTALSDGQVVTVTGTGFPGNSVGIIRQCGGTVTAPQCDPTTSTPFVTTAAGTIPPTAFATKRIVNTGATTFNCGVQTCFLLATAGPKSALHQVRMAGAGTVVTTSPTTTSTVPATTSSTVSSTTTSSTTTSTVPATTTSTSSPVPTSIVAANICTELRRTQRDAIAAIDTLIATFPRFRDAGTQAREATSSKLTQALAAAGC